jgi:hypothetical protein
MIEPDSTRPPLTGAALRARLLGNSLEHDRGIITFWQSASEETHGHALYELLALTERIMASVDTVWREPNRMILKAGRVIIQPRQ